MKACQPALLTYLSTHNIVNVAELFTFTLHDGTVYHWTNADANIVYQTVTYTCHVPTISFNGGTLRQSVGKEVSTLQVELGNAANVLGNGKTLQQSIHDGDFDDAQIIIDRIYMPSWGDMSLGTMRWFSGYVGEVKPKSLSVTLTLLSALDKLNRPFPKRLFQPSCPYALYDASCGLTKSYRTTTLATAGVDLISVTDLGVDYKLGSVQITTGPATGIYRSIINTFYGGGLQYMAVAPLYNTPPNIGDTVKLLVGCDKSWTRCGILGNTSRFGGFPSIPKPESIR
jgi:uncharacterized phage protein (TIGR02218 family)